MDLTKKQLEVIVSSDCSILEALKKMDSIKRKLLLVIDDEKYNGLLSIGDIQRGIISNIELSEPISSLKRGNYIVANTDSSLAHIKDMMYEIRAAFMPVINASGNVVDIHFWEDSFSTKESVPLDQFNLPVVIMAGGFGTRLQPITHILPKPLIPIGKKTMLEEIFDRFGKHGCTDFFISINYKAELIEFYLKSLSLPYNLDFFRELEPMGTAGSLTLLKNKIHSTFLVSNCDILIDQDYSEIIDYHKKHNNEITIVAALKHFPIAYGIIETGENGQLIDLKEKPELTFKINSGMYILEPHLLKEIPENNFFHITQLIEKIRQRNGNIGVFPVSEDSWKDVGDWPEYKKVLAHNGFNI